MEKSNILEITQIKISLPDKTIELSSEEARKVYEELDKLFNLEKKNDTLQEAAEDLKKILDKQKDSPNYVPYPIYVERPIKQPHWDYNKPIWLVDYEHLPQYTTTTPGFETTCLSINLTN